MEYSQNIRPLKITTPLGEDQFILTSLSGHERISGLFEFALKCAWQGTRPVVFKDILGKSVTVEIDLFDSTRYINGIVKSICQGAKVATADMTWYSIVIVPTMWKLTRRMDCRIFQNKDASEIVQQVLRDAGVSEVELHVTRELTKRDYCVQYDETDFAFVSRLMEFEGIYYFFKHEDGKHTLVLSDDKSAFADLPGSSNISFEDALGVRRDEPIIFDWLKQQEINSGKCSLQDFNFETPDSNLEANTITTVNVASNTSLELYRNPGPHLNHSEGQTLTDLRMAEEEMRTQAVHGKSYNPNMRPGYKFTLKQHPFDEGKFTITEVRHTAMQPLDTSAAGGGFAYENQFVCISFNTPYRAERVTPSPTVRGVQTAIVVGPGGEEIYTDKYGRVKVQFHWDRQGKKDENSSCWIRVATYWAGKQWGAIHIPRVGQEVIVDFVEGDVDRPLIVGSVYNANQMPPYGLPDNKTQSTLKSNSSKGGGGSNEIRFEDKKSSEEVYFHAEKDLNSVVENNETRKVGSSKADEGSRTTEIYKDETLTVKTGNMATTVEKGNQSTKVSMGNQSTEVSQGNQSTEIKMGNQSIKLGMGNQDTKLDLGASTHEAMQSITLKVGQNSIVIDQMGVTIKGLMISVEGQVQVEVKAPMIQVSADAMAMIKGGIVMIN